MNLYNKGYLVLGIFIFQGMNILNAQQLTYKTRAVGNSWIGAPGKHMQNHISNIEVADDGTVSTASVWDEGGHPRGKYKDGVYVGNSTGTINSMQEIDLKGKTWTIENSYRRFLNVTMNHGGGDANSTWTIDPVPTGVNAPYIKCSDGREIRSISDPSAIGINKVSGELMVADNGPDQNMKIFDISGEPVLTGTFGVQGGIYAGDHPGRKDDMLKFNGITGVGTDIEGNIYVACDGFPGNEAESGGADLRAFNPDGTLRWRMVGLLFVTSGCVDPLSGGSDIYSPYTHFRVDYSKSPGNNLNDWKDIGLSIDPFKYPDDPRLTGAVNICLAVVNANGNKYMFCTDMYNEPLMIYRFEGEIAVPCAVICAGYGWNGDEYIKFYWKHRRGRPDKPRWMWVDQNGDGYAQETEFDLFELGAPAERNFVNGINIDEEGNILFATEYGYWQFPTNGFDTYGNPKYSTESILHIPGPSFKPQSIKWIDELDIMVEGEGNSEALSAIHVYDNWSDTSKRSKRFSVSPPVGRSFNVTADPEYFYITYGIEDGPYTKSRGEILVYRMTDGEFVGYISPGPEVGSYSGWIDVDQPTFPYVRPNGERIICVEEDGVGKILIYEWCPDGTCEGACTTSVDSVEISEKKLDLEGFQEYTLFASVFPDTVCFDKVGWYSRDNSIATVDIGGQVTSLSEGSTWIIAFSEQEKEILDSCLLTVHPVPLEGIDIVRDSISLPINSHINLAVNFMPSNALNRKLSWESSSDALVSVDEDGTISGMNEGLVYVYAISEDGGFRDSCFIDVIPIPVDSIAFETTYEGIWLGSPVSMKVNIYPDNAYNKTVEWQILDEGLAIVDTLGIVTAMALGETKLIAVSQDGGFRDTCHIKVLKDNEFANLDIGNVCANGSYSAENGVATMTGSGSDIWNSSDEFHYAYQRRSNDVVIIARVNSIVRTNEWAKAGVMIRESAAMGSIFAMMVVTPDHGTSFQRRRIANDPAEHTTNEDGKKAPCWVKLVREGDTFTAYNSINGIEWEMIDSDIIEMSDDVTIGLCLTAHEDCQLTTAVFDYVIISDNLDTIPDIPNQAPTVSITSPINNATYPINEAVNITASASDIDGSIHKVEIFVDDQLIGTVSTSPYSIDYTFISTGEKFIWAKAFDDEGETEVSKTVSITVSDFTTIETQASEEKFSYYPNPAQDALTIQIKSDRQEVAHVKVFDQTGSLQFSEAFTLVPGQNKLDIGLESLKDGLYILSVNKYRTKLVIIK